MVEQYRNKQKNGLDVKNIDYVDKWSPNKLFYFFKPTVEENETSI